MTDSTTTVRTRPFRFGVTVPIRTDLPTWRDRILRFADSGYSTLLMPDFRQLQPSPGPTLAAAATLTGMRVGTWVYASPLRPTWSTAWEAHSLSVLTERRFEMGIGTGRPGIEDELRDLGMPVVPPSERLTQVRETVTMLRELDGSALYTPVVMAVHGPKAQALAADIADTVTFALMPGEARADVNAGCATSTPSGTLSCRSTSRSSATLSRRSWHLPIRPGCAACRGLAGDPSG